ncbi:MAG TPA: hypothetical protein VK890_00895 [Bacteroidia bacterium]|jgi:hypothetical protein|nr:hypothetical protein [Bacteroidia bacterium]
MRLLFLLLFLNIAFNLPAQELKLTGATSQRWYAGMAGGGNGVTYKITLETKDSTIIPDTVWIGSLIYANPNFIRTYNKVTNTSTYYFNNETNYECLKNPGVYNKDTAKTAAQAKLYIGEAMIRFHYKKIRYSLIVKSFETLPPLYYP